jgi:hypothetical protein
MLEGCTVAVLILLGAALDVVQAQKIPQTSVPASHSLTVNFDYDFRRTPACSAKIKKRCVRQFVVYDISAGAAKRSKLFTIPVPRDARGPVNGITSTSPRLSLESGEHLLAVVAQYPDGAESRSRACTAWIAIP